MFNTELAYQLREAINDHFYDPEVGAWRDGKGIDHHAIEQQEHQYWTRESATHKMMGIVWFFQDHRSLN